MTNWTLLPLIWLALSIAPNTFASGTTQDLSHVPIMDYQILSSAPHNPNSFIQGWEKHGATFYKSSGLYGRSYIQYYTSERTVTAKLPKRYFAEGLTLFNNTLYLLTWKEQTLILFNPKTLAIQRKLKYQGEGWGLTNNGQQLIMSNGSDTLFYRDPDSFEITKKLTIPGLDNINELEYVNGMLWANRLNDDHIYGIDPETGCLLGKANIKPLRQQLTGKHQANVLNGIAYDPVSKGLWVTGKYWPTRYLITLPQRPSTSDNCIPA